jgi:hypothetical protein
MHFVDLVNLNFFKHRMCDPTVIPEPLGEMQIYSFCRYVFLKSIPYIDLSWGPGRAILSNGKGGDRALSPLVLSRSLHSSRCLASSSCCLRRSFCSGRLGCVGSS